MKIRFLLITLLSMVLLGCKKGEDVSFKLSDTEITVPYTHYEATVSITTDLPWTAETSASWCTLSRYSAEGASFLVIFTEPNISGPREATVTIQSENKTETILVRQNGKDPNVELKYEIPVVFHVLYNDPNNPKQNIPYDQITRALRIANQLYAGLGSESGSPNINVEFVLATKDPLGQPLEEQGVHRVRWNKASINAPLFMVQKDKEHMALIWDPNKYINIMLYNFENQSILGISTFPLVPKNHPMKHLGIAPSATLSLADLDRVRCVSINSLYMDRASKDGQQNLLDVGPTLAHELGHYLGLRHVFSEAQNKLVPCQDTDHCMDTPSYDKQEYDSYVQYIFQRMEKDKEFAKNFSFSMLFERHSCFGEKFISKNLMDYDFCKKDYFSPEQKEIMRHVLTYSPFIPGPKIVDGESNRSHSATMSLPHELSHCPESLVVKYNAETSK